MQEIYRKAKAYMREQLMIEEGDRLCVGLSGGADSVCLLHILKRLQEEAESLPRFSLCAVHVHHGLRTEADADAAFAEALCKKREIPFFFYRFDVKARAAQDRIGLEEAGRLVRQEAYLDCVQANGVTKVALAHHANDRAETFLFHAARGSSLAGLASIRPVQELRIRSGEACDKIRVIRPLLWAARSEIETALQGAGLEWRTDHTNAEEQFARNKIRHRILPALEEVHAQAVAHIAQAAGDLAQADAFFKQEAADRLRLWAGQAETDDGPQAGGVFLPDAFRAENALLQGYILLQLLEETGGARKDLGREQVRQISELFDKPAGKQVDLPYGLHAERKKKGVQITQKNPYALRIRKGSSVIQ